MRRVGQNKLCAMCTRRVKQELHCDDSELDIHFHDRLADLPAMTNAYTSERLAGADRD